MPRSTGFRPKRTFREAAAKYLNEVQRKSLDKDAWCSERIDPFIGDLYLENVHMGTLRPYIEHGQKQGWKNRTINMPMEVVQAHPESRGGRMAGRAWSYMAPVSA